MPSLRSTVLLCDKEVRDAWRNRWFLLYAVAFTALALAMSWLSVAGAAGSGFAGLGRTTASLVSLVQLVVPLMGLSLGAGALAADRERGSLAFLLAQPLTMADVVLGKFLGLTCAIVASLVLGFGLAAAAISGRGAGDVGSYLAFLGLSVLLAAAMVSLGLLLSALASRASVAAGTALFLWLVLVVLGDLGMMGTAMVLELGAREVLVLSLVNPLQVFKIASVLAVRGGLESLGPAGLYAMRSWGTALLPVLVGLLAVWTVVCLGLTLGILRRRGPLP